MAEMERKRKQLESNKVTAKKKYFKRGELSAAIAEENEKKEKEKLKEKGLLSEHKKDDEDESDYIKNLIKPISEKSEQKYKEVSKAELIRRLREKGEPIKLFGETHEEACQRLRVIEMTSTDDDRGLRNDFKAAMDRLDQAYVDRLMSSKESGGEGSRNARDVQLPRNVLTAEEVTSLVRDMSGDNMEVDSKGVLEYFRWICHIWGQALNDRPTEEKVTLDGKLNSAQFEQTMDYMKPLFRKLRSVSLSLDILNSLTVIVQFLLQREYVKASDKYLEMAIGKAPWPIGVTNPGIHARTGREKISTALVAHVLNDETQRKYIQAIKRLITVCQKHFPTDPSKSLEYQKP